MISTYTSVGYGDVVGLNTLERFVSILNQMIGIFFFTYIISKFVSISRLINQNNAEHLIFKNKLEIIEEIDIRFEMSLALKKTLINHIKEEIQDNF